MEDSSERPKLTVLIPCKNEQENLGRCLDSVQAIADEIVVADSGSSDRTREIARERGCRVIEREYITSGDFKNWAIPQAAHEWVFLIDADERVTASLAREIRQVLEQGPKHTGYWVRRANHFFGHPTRHGALANDSVLRLFRRDLARYRGPSDHGEVHMQGSVGWLKQRLFHFSYWSWDQQFKKFHRYTKLQAQQWHEQGRRSSVLQLLFRPPLRFLRDYFIKLGCLDGVVGVQLAMLNAFYTFMKQARLWELQHAKSRETCERQLRERQRQSGGAKPPVTPPLRRAG